MKVGNVVRFLNDIGGGTISRIEGKTAYVVDSDGFETPVLLTQCVVVPSAANSGKQEKSEKIIRSDYPVKAEMPAAPRPKASGFNVCLLFEPQEIKRLSISPFDFYLVNDSNYSLHYAVCSRDRLESEWTLVADGVAEPSSQEFLGEFLPTELNQFENIAVRLFAVKVNEAFEMMPPLGMELRFDVTRLAKLHCFTPTAYSTVPVLTIPIVTNGKIFRPIDYDRLNTPEEPAPAQKRKSIPAEKNRREGPEVVDLHATELLDSTAGMQPAEILGYQLEVFDRKMKDIANKPGTEIIFIHGKGEGVLRKAILDRLRLKYPRCEAQDASFLEYGFGATKITIRK
ncbi:MAG: DUF2027 domain-containing protein [Muribaculaceae bacterium]|nr:DUF2027 domain-containing protein [Muribaculaceae bacterium]